MVEVSMAKLDQIMRHDDEGFVNLLNIIRRVENDQNVEQVIKPRFIDKNDPSYPNNVLHIFVENIPVKIGRALTSFHLIFFKKV